MNYHVMYVKLYCVYQIEKNIHGLLLIVSNRAESPDFNDTSRRLRK
ncbi:hypothetical protein LissoIVSPER_00014 [Lissonota sp. PSUC_FEM 10030012]|nr:hypothetical protein [Lissonota sp. PSUC_FEM 10030012]